VIVPLLIASAIVLLRWLVLLTRDNLLPYKYILVWGFVVTVAGPMINVVFEKWPKRVWRKFRRWIRAVAYPLCIGSGALLLTLGWKAYDSMMREKAIMAGVATEWRLNEIDLLFAPFWRDAVVKAEGNISEESFPPFSVSEVTNAINESSSVMEDNKLAEKLVLYRYDIRRFNYLIDGFNNTPFRKTRVSVVQRIFAEGQDYAKLCNSHGALGEYLQRHYPDANQIGFRRVGGFTEPLKVRVDRFKARIKDRSEVPPVREPNVPPPK